MFRFSRQLEAWQGTDVLKILHVYDPTESGITKMRRRKHGTAYIIVCTGMKVWRRENTKADRQTDRHADMQTDRQTVKHVIAKTQQKVSVPLTGHAVAKDTTN